MLEIRDIEITPQMLSVISELDAARATQKIEKNFYR